jgi:AAA domain, putative AbiEii toxin, Type IV TA system
MLSNIHLEGVRCFRSGTEIPTAKLTLAVGENSSGKSTFLAMVRCAWDLFSLDDPHFNEPPFALGSYDSIAHYHGGRGKRVAQFKIGATVAASSFMMHDRSLREYTFLASFISRRGHPVIDEWSVVEGHRSLILRPDEREAVFRNRRKETNVSLEEVLVSDGMPLTYVRQQLVFRLLSALSETKAPTMDQDVAWLQGVGFGAYFGKRPRAIAPIRTHPKRTYDATRDEPSPEGEHVPALLSRYHAEPDSKKWRHLADELKRFGNNSGLFRELEVRHLARKAETGPFQLEFSMLGQQGMRNILDLGYGVSQILPVLVECLGSEPEPLLLQQPEVHLHPRAQAELGTFLARTASQGGRQIVVETHSDHLIDRITLAVREGKLKPGDVQLLFFEIEGGASKVHACSVDRTGRFEQPPSYRAFFLKEQAKVLGL